MPTYNHSYICKFERCKNEWSALVSHRFRLGFCGKCGVMSYPIGTKQILYSQYECDVHPGIFEVSDLENCPGAMNCKEPGCKAFVRTTIRDYSVDI